MRILISLVSTFAVATLSAASAHADDNTQANRSEANVFNADMSNPDLAAVITSFQDVCLPFITHKTELTKQANQAYRVERLAEQGFAFQSREPQPAHIELGWVEEPWTGPQRIMGKSIETLLVQGPTLKLKYKTLDRDLDNYIFEAVNRQTALLEWNYVSQNHPAKSCEIRLDNASISSKTFEADFISKDPDWHAVINSDGTWSQCNTDGPDEFEFTVENRDGVLSLSVRRNDFYEPKLCLNNSSAGF